MEVEMAATLLDAVQFFNGNEILVSNNGEVKKMQDKLVEQGKKLRLLQQNFLKERYAKESLQSDLEHILYQLKALQKVQEFAKQIDIAYL
jgi:hypothetical protein